jgi:hypothetical protein
MTASTTPDDPTSDPTTPSGAAGPTVRWDDSAMKTSYANVVNVTSTREEVSAFFGTNRTWNAQPGESLEVQLDNRIIMSPFAAKRLLVLLGGVLREYEKRFGPLPNPPR